KACEKAGLDQPSYEHGLDLRNGQKAASYVSKWGVEHEMTKGHIKKGKTDSKTPFDLLRDYAEGDENA
ncbi:replication protein, partial [Acinetobacter baumannii]